MDSGDDRGIVQNQKRTRAQIKWNAERLSIASWEER